MSASTPALPPAVSNPKVAQRVQQFAYEDVSVAMQVRTLSIVQITSIISSTSCQIFNKPHQALVKSFAHHPLTEIQIFLYVAENQIHILNPRDDVTGTCDSQDLEPVIGTQSSTTVLCFSRVLQMACGMPLGADTL